MKLIWPKLFGEIPFDFALTCQYKFAGTEVCFVNATGKEFYILNCIPLRFITRQWRLWFCCAGLLPPVVCHLLVFVASLCRIPRYQADMSSLDMMRVMRRLITRMTSTIALMRGIRSCGRITSVCADDMIAVATQYIVDHKCYMSLKSVTILHVCQMLQMLQVLHVCQMYLILSYLYVP